MKYYYISVWLFIIWMGIMSTLSNNNALNIKLVEKLAIQVYKGNKVLADLTTAQAILESNLLGQKPSQLAFKYNNLFGIKGQGTKGNVLLPTEEVINGQKVTVQATFAWNNSVEDSIAQRQNLFEHGTTGDPTRYFKVLSATTFEQAAEAVYQAGYCTDPTYSSQLIKIYNQYLKGN